jgi:UDP-N-acetylglucosamine 4-epimerase
MTAYRRLLETLGAEPRTWLITGVAGFIGSHLLEALLKLGQRVIGFDNFSTGTPRNLDAVQASVGERKWENFSLRRGSVADIGVCREASDHVDYVLHQAGFVSVPLSIEDPVACHDTNVTGTLNMLVAARDNRVQRLVFASSSAVYGNSPHVPQSEEPLGEPLSPYGASKQMAELHAQQFFMHYGLETVGLRYFNIFGPRQNPIGGYAAVIPQWIGNLLRGEECVIHGDGTATRDFCHVMNVVQANLLAAAATSSPSVAGEVFNVGLGQRTDLNALYELISVEVAARGPKFTPRPPRHGPWRGGDILHSGADVSRIARELGYEPEENLKRGIEETVRWFYEDTST